MSMGVIGVIVHRQHDFVSMKMLVLLHDLLRDFSALVRCYVRAWGEGEDIVVISPAARLAIVGLGYLHLLQCVFGPAVDPLDQSRLTLHIVHCTSERRLAVHCLKDWHIRSTSAMFDARSYLLIVLPLFLA